MRAIEKVCPRCRISKPRSQFHNNASRRDGLATYCRDCTNESNRENGISPKRKRELLLYGRRYREQHREKVRQRLREQWTPERAARCKELRDPRKEWARNLLRTAVHRGKIKKPEVCQDCGKPGRIHGHHEDYSKPFDVVWICSICHGKRHRMTV